MDFLGSHLIMNAPLSVDKEGCNRGHGLSAAIADKPCPLLQPSLHHTYYPAVPDLNQNQCNLLPRQAISSAKCLLYFLYTPAFSKEV